jgi:titin
VPDAPVNLANLVAVTKAEQIGFSWQDGAEDGGTAVLDHKILISVSGGAYTTLETAVVERSYTATTLTPGIYYGFKVQARNSFGYSSASAEVIIYSGEIPATPEAPTTTFQRDTVLVSWTAPFNGGAPILGYRVYFETSAGSFYMELDDCDGNLQAIVDTQQCTVFVSTLKSEPFSLDWGAEIKVKLLAFNTYGDSAMSAVGGGAFIITYADAPRTLAEVVASRTPSSITFTWLAGAEDGGSTVTDYRVSSDQALSVWTVIGSGVTGLTFTATGLTAGLVYSFKVEAQNGFGYSAYSSPVSILCATVPSKVALPTTTNSGPNIIFDWNEPANNGLPILTYQVWIRKSD